MKTSSRSRLGTKGISTTESPPCQRSYLTQSAVSVNSITVKWGREKSMLTTTTLQAANEVSSVAPDPECSYSPISGAATTAAPAIAPLIPRNPLSSSPPTAADSALAIL